MTEEAATYEDVGIEPGTEAWRAVRKYCVGASDIGWITGESPYGDMADLWEIKTDRAPEPFEHPGMTRGKDLEDAARKATERYLSQLLWKEDGYDQARVFLAPRFIRSTVYREPQLVVTLDGDNPEHDVTVEIKVPYESEHLEAICGRIPHKHRSQLQAQFMVRRPKRHFFASFDPDMKDHELAVVEVQPDPDYWLEIQKMLTKFGEHLRTDTRPTTTKPEQILLDEFHGKGQFKKLADAWLEAKAALTENEALEKGRAGLLKEYMKALGDRVRGCGVVFSSYDQGNGIDLDSAIKDGVVDGGLLLPYTRPKKHIDKLTREKGGES